MNALNPVRPILKTLKADKILDLSNDGSGKKKKLLATKESQIHDQDIAKL